MSEITLTSADNAKLKEGINEMTNSLIKIEMEREAMGDISSALSKNFGIKKSILNKVAKAHQKHKYAEMQQENDNFEFVYESLMGPSTD